MLCVTVLCLLAEHGAAEGGTPPPACDKLKSKSDCHNDGLDCAWCEKSKKCVDWDPCKNKASGCKGEEFSVSKVDRKNAKSQCTSKQIIIWIAIVATAAGVLCCIAACVLKFCKCDLTSCCKRQRRRHAYSQIEDPYEDL